MNLTDSVRGLLKLLKYSNSTFSSDDKIHVYTQLISTLEKVCEDEVIIEDNGLHAGLIEIIETDICNVSKEIQLCALNTMIVFLKCRRQLDIVNIHERYLYLAFDDSVNITQDVHDAAYTCVELLLPVVLSHKDFSLEDLIQKVPNLGVQNKFTKLLLSICLKLPIKERALFFYTRMVSLVFMTNQQEIRIFCRQVALSLQPEIEVTLLSKDQFNMFKAEIKSSYIPKIKEFQASKNPEWHLLTITLIKCCGRLLHTEVDIVNLVLQFPQAAFRSGNVTTYIEGYDCWKALIDVYSLDLNHLCSTKKLLPIIITPLKTNISRSLPVTHKRFELWLHLASILKHRFIDCLKDFLDFCFGSLSETPFIALNAPERQVPGRFLWQETTTAFLEIMGHYNHSAKESCFDSGVSIDFKLEEPIISQDWFKSNTNTIINAIGECSLLMLNSPNIPNTLKALKCLWGSLFSIIQQLEQKEQEITLEKVTLLLAVCIQNRKECDHLICLLKLVIELLLDKLFFSTEMLNKILIYPLVTNYMKHGDLTAFCEDDVFVQLFHFAQNTSNSTDWFNTACEIFLIARDSGQTKNLLGLWVEVVPLVQNIFSTSNSIEQMDSIIDFWMWPLICVDNLSADQKKDCSRTWLTTTKEISKIFPDQTVLILQNMLLNVKESDVHTFTIIFELLPHLYKQVRGSQHLVEDVLQVTSELLTHKLDTNTQKLLSAVLMDLMLCLEDDTLTKVSLEAFCGCCENALTFQKSYDILEVLVELFKKIPKPMINSIPTSLIKNIRSLTTHENKTISQNAAVIVAKFGKKTLVSPKPYSRAAKITGMVNSDMHKNVKSSPTLTLFEVKSDSPKRLRGSMIKSSPKRVIENTKPSKVHKSVIDYDDEANFVLIDEQYDFDPDKLSDHQLEKLKEKRCDIPALYQDLSQSQSASQCFQDIVQEAKAIYTKKDMSNNNDSKPVNVFKLPSLEKSVEEINHTLSSNVKTDTQQNNAANKNSATNSNSINHVKPKRRVALVRVLENSDVASEIKVLNSTDNTIKNGKNPNDITHNPNEMLNVSNTVSNIDSEKDTQAKNKKLSRELNRIKLDIVGGDSYLKNINGCEKRKTRKNNVNVHPGHANKFDSDFPKSQKSAERAKDAKVMSNKLPNKTHSEKFKENLSSPNANENNGQPKKLSRKRHLSTTADGCEIDKENVKDDQVSEGKRKCTEDDKYNFSDVIESSQESYVDIIPCKNTIVANTSTKELMAEPTSSLLFCCSTEELEIKNLIANADMCSPEQIMQMDLLSKKSSSNREISIAEMDTESQTDNLNKEVPEIPTSPVGLDTPTRTKDLMDSTINISPIRLFSSNDEDPDSPEKTPDLFDSESCAEANQKSNLSTIAGEKNIDVDKTPGTDATDHPRLSTTFNNLSVMNGSARTRKLLKLLSNTLSPKKKNNGSSSDRFVSINSVPNTSKSGRIIKMMENCAPENNIPSLNNIDLEIEDSDDEEEIAIPENRILRFVREIPSPLASPKCSILKRKSPDTADEGLSPPKKKRVNFPDPPLTCQKIIIKDQNEHLTSVKKLINTSIVHDIPALEVVPEELVELFPNNEIPKTEEDDENNEILYDIFECETQSLPIDTQGSVEFVQTHLLEEEKPVCPELVTCEDTIENIIQKIPTFAQDILKELKSKQIVTIGDLARLTEIEINRLPFKPPKLWTVQHSLMKYLEEQSNQDKDVELANEDMEFDVLELSNSTTDIENWKKAPVANEPTSEKTDENLVVSKCSNSNATFATLLRTVEARAPKRNSIEEIRNCFEEIVTQAKKEGLQLCLGKQLVDIVGVDVLLSVLINSGELFKEESVASVLSEITKNFGIDNLLPFVLKLPNISPYMVVDTCLNHISESDAASVCLKLVTRKLSINQILQTIGLDLILQGLHYMQQESQFSLKDLFSTIMFKFSPTLEDICASFRYVKLIHINDQTIELKSTEKEELNSFIRKALLAYESKDLVTVVPKERMLSNYTHTELIDALVKSNSHSVTDSIELLLSKLPNDSDTMETLMNNVIEKYSVNSVWQFLLKIVNKHINDCQFRSNNS